MMNVEQLIELVSKRPALWDRSHPKHQNKQASDICWKEICLEMNEDEYKLRKKWKYLRDQFPVELGKAEHHCDVDGTAVSKWPYFRSLMFLKDNVKPRKYVYRQSGSSSQNTETSDLTDNDNDINLFGTPTSDQEVKYGVKRKYEDDDEHLYFFKSLVPHIRRIPQHRLLAFRSSIQEVVEQYAYGPQQFVPGFNYNGSNECVSRVGRVSPEVQIKEEK